MFETAFTIEWGDCDENGIVFYPNYFYWLDCTYQRWLRRHGLSQRELRRRFKSVTPLVDVGAKFMGPARYDDELQVRAEVSEWRSGDFGSTTRFPWEASPWPPASSSVPGQLLQRRENFAERASRSSSRN